MSERERWERHFEAFEASVAAAPEPGWLAARRRAARDAFRAAGFPHTKLEDWRYTNVSALARTDWVPAFGPSGPVARPDLEALSTPVYACNLYVFVNGRFAPELSAPAALRSRVEVGSLADAVAAAPDAWSALVGSLADPKQHPFAALSGGFLGEGAAVRIPRGADAEAPIHLVFASTPDAAPTATFPRVAIRAEAGSRATLIEDYVALGAGDRLTVSVCEVRVEANAELRHVRLQRESDACRHVSLVAAQVERDGRYATTAVSLGGRLVRNDVDVVLSGEGAETTLDGLYVGAGERHVDNQTRIDHAVPHTASREAYKGLLADRSRGVFRGRVVVRPDAQKSDAEQSSQSLLLSADAEVDAKPQLEIHADDVKCSHGSTIGQLDPDALFFLRARGIGEDDARGLLTRAFASEITGRIGVEPVAARILELLEAQLGGPR